MNFTRSVSVIRGWLIAVCLVGMGVHGVSQVGIKAVGTFAKNRIAESTSQERLFSSRFGLGADYWFRLKKYRLEFLPSIHLQYGRERFNITDQVVGDLSWSSLDFTPAIQFYPLDFFSDCQCPTFSKQGKFLKKGLFLSLAPGIGYHVLNSKNLNESSGDWLLFGRAGLGLDIGLSDLLTLSPAVHYQLSQNMNWSRYFLSSNSASLDINSGLFLSLRLGLRMDKNRY
jgi:hypothetical protein